MRGQFRLPLVLVAAALLALVAALAILQFRWLGRISEAERDSRRSTLNAHASAFAADFDRELTLAYVLFQLDPVIDAAVSPAPLASRVADRYDRWRASAAHPRLIKECYLARADAFDAEPLQHFNIATRTLEPAAWPAALEGLRRDLRGEKSEKRADGTFFVRSLAGALRSGVPALVVPLPMVSLGSLPAAPAAEPSLSYTILLLDREYITRTMLPGLAARHFRGFGDVEYQLAVVDLGGGRLEYQSAREFAPQPADRVDASADLFQVRPQEFAEVVADVRRFLVAARTAETAAGYVVPRGGMPAETRAHVVRHERGGSAPGRAPSSTGKQRTFVTAIGAAGAAPPAPGWRLLVKHPAGSLEAAVESTRRRNLVISSGILGVLAASMVLLVAATRRSQEVARQQMEFVAAVSHELRTPLAVIRSAGDNLAEGVVASPAQTRQYGELVRSEGRRLSEMVEQILEFAGIGSGQRRLERTPVDAARLVESVVAASSPLIDDAGLVLDVDTPADLPAILGDEAALRRALQNLVGNAIKYGAQGGWIGIRTRASDGWVSISVADRGIGIAPADQSRIFDPFYRAADVVAAQVHGAGLGLSLVQRVVQAHGGDVTIVSSPGEGAEFTLRLPAARPVAQAPDGRAAAVNRLT